MEGSITPALTSIFMFFSIMIGLIYIMKIDIKNRVLEDQEESEEIKNRMIKFRRENTEQIESDAARLRTEVLKTKADAFLIRPVKNNQIPMRFQMWEYLLDKDQTGYVKISVCDRRHTDISHYEVFAPSLLKSLSHQKQTAMLKELSAKIKLAEKMQGLILEMNDIQPLGFEGMQGICGGAIAIQKRNTFFDFFRF